VHSASSGLSVGAYAYVSSHGYSVKYVGTTPRTFTKEYQEATNERAIEQKMNPITGEKSDGYRNSRAHIGGCTRYHIGGLQGHRLCCLQVKCLRKGWPLIGCEAGCAWTSRRHIRIFHPSPDFAPTVPATSFPLSLCNKLKYRTCFFFFLILLGGQVLGFMKKCLFYPCRNSTAYIAQNQPSMMVWKLGNTSSSSSVFRITS